MYANKSRDEKLRAVWARNRVEETGGFVEETIKGSDAILFLLLALSSLMVLEPVKDVFTLDMAVCSKPTGDLLYLIGARCSYPLLVKILKQRYLFFRWVPTRTASRSCAPFVFHLYFDYIFETKLGVLRGVSAWKSWGRLSYLYRNLVRLWDHL